MQSKLNAFTWMACLFGGGGEGAKGDDGGSKPSLSATLSILPSAGHSSVSSEIDWWDAISTGEKGNVVGERMPGHRKTPGYRFEASLNAEMGIKKGGKTLSFRSESDSAAK